MGLERSLVVDEVLVHRPVACGGCGAGLDPGVEHGRRVVRQVQDLPVPRLWVTDHELVAVACPCGHVTRAAPVGVSAPVSYGPRLVAAAAYLQVAQMLPVQRAAQTLADLCGASVSVGFVAGALGRVAHAVEPANKAIAVKIADQVGAVFFDESATKIAGKEHWFHAQPPGS